MKSHPSKPLAVAAFLLLSAATAQAVPILTASSDGAGLVVDASLLGTQAISATLPGQVQVFGTPILPALTGSAAKGATTAGASYASSGSVVVATSQTKAVAVVAPYTVNSAKVDLNASALYGSASFDGTTVTGNGGVANASLGLSATSTLDLPLLPPVTTNLWSLSVGAQALETTSTVSWSGSSLIGSNTLNSFAGLTLSLAIGTAGPLVLDLSSYTLAYLTANPNTRAFAGILDPLGLSLVLNEQIDTCPSALACSVESNALHLQTNPLQLGLADVDLKLGHSFASAAQLQVAAVPEPETWALMGVGLALLSFGARFRGRRAQG